MVNYDDLNAIFRDVFENEHITIDAASKASDFEEWDSLNHIYLVVAIEKFYKIKFTTQQIQVWTCVEDIVNDIIKLKG
ncbi:MAG: acyl carrier protein [Bacteroidia bacterium]|nr:acyl carrier protein [Bacteroidia bacterium]MCC7532447.1 acyl carrier protein [Bacteroidia bacterium]